MEAHIRCFLEEIYEDFGAVYLDCRQKGVEGGCRISELVDDGSSCGHGAVKLIHGICKVDSFGLSKLDVANVCGRKVVERCFDPENEACEEDGGVCGGVVREGKARGRIS